MAVGSDYNQQQVQVSLQPPLMNNKEISIDLVNDDIVEITERFLVQTIPNTSQIFVPIAFQVVEVYILDDDSKPHTEAEISLVI